MQEGKSYSIIQREAQFSRHRFLSEDIIWGTLSSKTPPHVQAGKYSHNHTKTKTKSLLQAKLPGHTTTTKSLPQL